MISVCMPHWNAIVKLYETVESLRKEVDVEIIVADDGSALAPTISGVRVIRLPRKDHALNPCVPINRAVGAARGPLVALTNPGTRFSYGMLDSLADSVITPLHYVTAACRDPATGRWLAHSSVTGGEYGRLPMPPGSSFHFLAVFHLDLWAKTGGFCCEYRDGQACEDNDWLWRLDAAGATFVQRDDVVVENERSTTTWPAGGLERNRAILERRWGHKWTVS